MPELFPPSHQEMLDSALREVERRVDTYPALISSRKIHRDKAQREIDCMKAIAEILAAPAAFEQFKVRGRYLRASGVVAEKAEIVCDVKIPVPGWIQQRLVEVRIAVTPMALSFLAREAARMLGKMNDDGGLLQPGQRATDWAPPAVRA